jgi:hypothetical protein
MYRAQITGAARPERAMLFTIEAWDINRSQHVPRKLDVEAVIAKFTGTR